MSDRNKSRWCYLYVNFAIFRSHRKPDAVFGPVIWLLYLFVIRFFDAENWMRWK